MDHYYAFALIRAVHLKAKLTDVINIDIEDVPVFSQLREQKIFGTGTIGRAKAATTKISLQNIPIFTLQYDFLCYSRRTKWLKLELGVLRGFGLRCGQNEFFRVAVFQTKENAGNVLQTRSCKYGTVTFTSF